MTNYLILVIGISRLEFPDCPKASSPVHTYIIPLNTNIILQSLDFSGKKPGAEAFSAFYGPYSEAKQLSISISDSLQTKSHRPEKSREMLWAGSVHKTWKFTSV